MLWPPIRRRAEPHPVMAQRYGILPFLLLDARAVVCRRKIILSMCVCVCVVERCHCGLWQGVHAPVLKRPKCQAWPEQGVIQGAELGGRPVSFFNPKKFDGDSTIRYIIKYQAGVEKTLYVAKAMQEEFLQALFEEAMDDGDYRLELAREIFWTGSTKHSPFRNAESPS